MWATFSKLEIQLQTTIEVCHKMEKSKNKEGDTLLEWVKACELIESNSNQQTQQGQ